MQGRIDSSAVIFGDFKFLDIQKDVIVLQDLLKDFHVFASVSQAIEMPVILPIVDFISQSANINIQIANNRINIVKPISIDEFGSKVKYDDEEFLCIVQDVQKRLIKHYDVAGSRISYIVNFCKDSSSEIEEVKKKLSNDYLYRYSDSFEWNARNAVKETFTINDKAEEINVITIINYEPSSMRITIDNNTIDIGGLIYNLDINTVPTNIQTRINDNFISEFYSYALELVRKIEGGY